MQYLRHELGAEPSVRIRRPSVDPDADQEKQTDQNQICQGDEHDRANFFRNTELFIQQLHQRSNQCRHDKSNQKRCQNRDAVLKGKINDCGDACRKQNIPYKVFLF